MVLCVAGPNLAINGAGGRGAGVGVNGTWGGGVIPVGSGTNKEARTCRHYYYSISIRCTSCRVRHLKRSGVQGCLSGYGFLYWKFYWSNLSFVCWYCGRGFRNWHCRHQSRVCVNIE